MTGVCRSRASLVDTKIDGATNAFRACSVASLMSRIVSLTAARRRRRLKVEACGCTRCGWGRVTIPEEVNSMDGRYDVGLNPVNSQGIMTVGLFEKIGGNWRGMRTRGCLTPAPRNMGGGPRGNEGGETK